MGTWSISPDTGLVSIDQNGLLTYSEHTSDTVYTISYSDDDCTATKNVTIRGCTPCNCADLTVTGITNISKDGGDNITIGSFSKASCMSNPRASSSESWLSNITVSGNGIKATVGANSESDSRSGSVTVTVDKEGGGTCDKTMNITQSAGGGGGGTFAMECAIELRDGLEPGEEWWGDSLAIEYLLVNGKKPGDTEFTRYKIPVNLTGMRNTYMTEPLELDEEWKGMEVADIGLFIEGDTPPEDTGRATSIEDWRPDFTNWKFDEGQYFRLFCQKNFK